MAIGMSVQAPLRRALAPLSELSPSEAKAKLKLWLYDPVQEGKVRLLDKDSVPEGHKKIMNKAENIK